MTGSEIAFTGLQRQYQNLKAELLDATDRVLTSGQVLDGPYVNYFERQMARRCGRQFAIAVNSCSQALIFAQGALGITGKVLIPTQSFVATLNSVIMAGNEPVFCDIDDRALMDLEMMSYKLSEADIKGIMYVNLYGNVLDYDKFRTIVNFFNPHSDIKVIEDAAQSFGASYKGIPSGKLGDVSVLSFDPTKNLPNFGSGGMILTDNDEIATICYDLRDNGKQGFHCHPGTNSKMSEVDCAHMLIKLKHFDRWQKRRAEIAEFYTEHLSTYVDPILPNEDVEHAWHKYVIRVSSRDNLQAYMGKQGIQTKIHYETPLHEYDIAYDYYNYATDVFRTSHAHSKESLSLPIYPEMTDAEVEAVANAVVAYYN